MSNSRFGIRLGRNGLGRSRRLITGEQWAYSLFMMSQMSVHFTVRNPKSFALFHLKCLEIKLFTDIRTWFNNVEQHASEGVHKILIGNKCDWEEKRAVSTEQGQQLADELGIPFLEVSAKNNINIEKAFYNLASDIKKGMDTSKSEQSGSQGVTIDQQGSGVNGNVGGKCC